MKHLDASKPLAQYAFEEMGFVVTDRISSQAAVQVVERSATIEYFGNAKPQIRGGLFFQNNCAVFGVLLAIGQVVKYVYTSWLNFHREYDRQVLLAMENQELLMICFYGSNLKIGRIYLINNCLADIARRARIYVEKLPAWSPDAYEKVVSGVSVQLGHGMTLWQKLESGVPLINLDRLPN